MAKRARRKNNGAGERTSLLHIGRVHGALVVG
jgi:hypothetical protein